MIEQSFTLLATSGLKNRSLGSTTGGLVKILAPVGRRIQALGREALHAMTALDFHRLESELNISLPSDYRNIMAAYCFPEGSITADFLLRNSVDELLAISAKGKNLPAHSFIIGQDDEEGEAYFIDASREHSPVYVLSIGSNKVTERFSCLEAYVQFCRKTDEKWSRYGEKIENRKWWQFWIPKI